MRLLLNVQFQINPRLKNRCLWIQIRIVYIFQEKRGDQVYLEYLPL